MWAGNPPAMPVQLRQGAISTDTKDMFLSGTKEFILSGFAK